MKLNVLVKTSQPICTKGRRVESLTNIRGNVDMQYLHVAIVVIAPSISRIAKRIELVNYRRNAFDCFFASLGELIVIELVGLDFQTLVSVSVEDVEKVLALKGVDFHGRI